MVENNKTRKEQGYAPMTLVGWAEQPSYDKGQHKLYWAKELHTDGDKDNGLNYNIRVLGREGVLVLNAVSGMEQIAQIKTEMKKVTGFTEFTPGNRYPTSTPAPTRWRNMALPRWWLAASRPSWASSARSLPCCWP
jgi:uncharacterized membrane-anchored protein